MHASEQDSYVSLGGRCAQTENYRTEGGPERDLRRHKRHLGIFLGGGCKISVLADSQKNVSRFAQNYLSQ